MLSLFMMISFSMSAAEPEKMLFPPDEDARVSQVRETDTVFAMTHFNSLAEWKTYAESLRTRILVACGLYPLPKRTPLNVRVTGETTRDTYRVENVAIEAWPGFFVTGNLYRPLGKGPFPAIACPHGHWAAGRFEHSDIACVAARCITFARMGIVAFSYDMVGYQDSCQFSKKWGHDPSAFPEERKREALWAIHPFAIQLWSGIRVLDYLQSLDFVDPDRLGCTGASGGGTQTFALCAVDSRVKAAAPVNMISHTMQGGCMCENAPLIRINASNMEIGALMAPRPLLMIAATGDWTKTTPQVEYPAIRGIYALYNATDKIEMHQVDAGHNYNQQSREYVYRFFAHWLLHRGKDFEQFTEPSFTMEPVEKLRVFPNGLPDDALTAEQITQEIIDNETARVKKALPETREELKTFQQRYRTALAIITSASLPATGELVRRRTGNNPKYTDFLLGRKSAGDSVPARLYLPEHATGAVLVVSDKGIAGVDDAQVDSLLQAHKAVMTITPFLVNSSQKRAHGRFPDTFVPTDTACRIQDVLTAAAHLRVMEGVDSIEAIGIGDAGLWVLLAAALSPVIQQADVDLRAFDVKDGDPWENTFYLPCIKSIGELETALLLTAPRAITVRGTEKQVHTVATLLKKIGIHSLDHK